MKKLLLLTVICLGFVSCIDHSKDVPTTGTEFKINEYSMDIYVIDSCEYLGRSIGFNTGVLAHKGNCKYCIQRNKK